MLCICKDVGTPCTDSIAIDAERSESSEQTLATSLPLAGGHIGLQQQRNQAPRPFSSSSQQPKACIAQRGAPRTCLSPTALEMPSRGACTSSGITACCLIAHESGRTVAAFHRS